MQHKNPNSRTSLQVVLPLCLLGSAGVAHAMPGADAGNAGVQARQSVEAPPADQAGPDIPGLGQPTSDASLDHVRGGFDLGSGLVASFGLQEETYINGLLVMSTNINIPDISKITQQQAAALASTLDGLNLVQNGPGNSVASGKAPATPAPGSTGKSANPMPASQAPVAAVATRPGTSNGGSGAYVPNQQSTITPVMDAPPEALGAPAPGSINVTSAATRNTMSSAAAAASALAQGGALAQVVQNTLNNQSIQTLTTLNVSVNTLQALRQMNLQNTLQSAQLLSLGH
ncbi:hypothetical protein [Rhodanobacter geophilus]|uniref:Flagellin n=1 Tax=Rhodanobacter geophilus TaxID=3162488 RepID=A0ABV3QKT3_9GAMM